MYQNVFREDTSLSVTPIVTQPGRCGGQQRGPCAIPDVVLMSNVFLKCICQLPSFNVKCIPIQLKKLSCEGESSTMPQIAGRC